MRNKLLLLLWLNLLLLTGCGGSGSDNSAEISAVDNSPSQNSNGDTNADGCIGFCASSTSLLTKTDVENIISQAVSEAQARQLKATIAVTDRVGNVLAVFRMNDAKKFITISSTAEPLAKLSKKTLILVKTMRLQDRCLVCNLVNSLVVILTYALVR